MTTPETESKPADLPLMAIRDPGRITGNRDVWLQETVALLSETSMEMVKLMAGNPKESMPFMRVFGLVTHLAADTKRLLNQEASPPNKPPVAPAITGEDNDGMKDRVAALEGDMKDVRERLTRVETKVDAIDKSVAALPSKDFVENKVSGGATRIILWTIVIVGASQLIPSIGLPLLKHFGVGG